MEGCISIIVPIYNVEQYLNTCVQSIISQTYRNLEIILVDDGSPDNCPKLCDDWMKKDQRIRVIHKPNGGLSDARNAGIEIATGEYIAFVDSDDWIMPNMYEKMLEALIRENADMCSCRVCSCYSDGRKVEWGYDKYLCAKSEEVLKLLYQDTAFPVSAWNKLYRRHCWDTLRFPVGKICEDAFTTYLQIDHANRIVHLPEAYYCYRIRPQSIMTSSFNKKRMDEEEAWRKNYEYMKDHYPKVFQQAYSFYLQKVNVLIHTIPQNRIDEFRNEYDFLRKILKNNRLYITLRSGIPAKQRVRLLLDIQKL